MITTKLRMGKNLQDIPYFISTNPLLHIQHGPQSFYRANSDTLHFCCQHPWGVYCVWEGKLFSAILKNIKGPFPEVSLQRRVADTEWNVEIYVILCMEKLAVCGIIYSTVTYYEDNISISCLSITPTL